MILYADELSGQWIVIAAGAIVAVWLLMRRPFKQRSEARENSPSRSEKKSSVGGGHGLMDAPDQLAKWEVSMHETARDLKAEIDTKMVALQALIAMAQQQADRLEAVVIRAERINASLPRDCRTELDRIAETGKTLASSGAVSNAAASNGAASNPPSLTNDDKPSPPTTFLLPLQLRERIYSQADQGLPPASIAANMGVPVGEIEWMLNSRGGTER